MLYSHLTKFIPSSEKPVKSRKKIMPLHVLNLLMLIIFTKNALQPMSNMFTSLGNIYMYASEALIVMTLRFITSATPWSSC